MRRHDVKWAVLRAADGLGMRNHSVARRMGISPQSFCYRLKNGFTMAEILHLRRILKDERIGMLIDDESMSDREEEGNVQP